MRFYLYDAYKNSTIVFSNLDHLIYYFHHSTFRDWKNTYAKSKKPLRDCHLFHCMAMNFNELSYEPTIDTIFGLSYTRHLMLFDEDDRIVDVRDYRYQILNGLFDVSKFKNKEKPRFTYTYRYDPVPRTGTKHRDYWRPWPKVLGEAKKNEDPEHKPFVKPKRQFQTICDVYCSHDAKIRSNAHDKCWKRKKVKKQWMKNLK